MGRFKLLKGKENNMVLLFSGSAHGNELANYIYNNNIDGTVCVSSQFNKMILPEDTNNFKVIVDKMSSRKIADFIVKNGVDKVIDATMPYEVRESKVIDEGVFLAREENCNVSLICIDDEREEIEDAVYFDTYEEISNYLNTKHGNIMLTVGNNDVEKFAGINNFSGRIYARMVMINSMVNSLEQKGFVKEHFIFDKGVFDVDQNIQMIRRYNIKYFVTKDTGAEGGLAQKAAAAKRTHIELIILRRPVIKDGVDVATAIQMI